MPTVLTYDAVEESTYAVEATFYDEDNNLIEPVTVTWSLTSSTGAVINNRSGVSITPATTITIVLQGDDLALLPGENGAVSRVLTVVATYNSNLGSSLPLHDEASFTLLDLRAIT
jgi:hypothetical protein